MNVTTNPVSEKLEALAERITGFSIFLRSRCRVVFALWVLSAFILGALSNAWAESGDSHDAFAALRAIRKTEKSNPRIGETFNPVQNETIVFIGGTNAVEQQIANYFEAMATLSWPEKFLRFRNLAWEADTIYRQQRPLYFFDRNKSDQRAGSTPDQRQRVEVGTVVIRFGKMESLDGVQRVGQFRNAYGKFLDELIEITPRVIVVTPTPFFLSGPASALARERNEVLDVYSEAIRAAADERSLRVVDLFKVIPESGPFSENGIHLNDEGQRSVALAMLKALDGSITTEASDSPEFDQLRDRIAYKNSIWLQYFRPTNWSFLYGDRQHVPSSRSHLDSEKRWFPFEIERALTLIEQEEREIAAMAGKKAAGK